MYLNFDPTPYGWMAALKTWSIVVSVMFGVGLGVAILSSLFMHGRRGPGRVLRAFGLAVADFVRVSPRRIAAITSLTFKEAVRKRALLVFVNFAVLFMFASWFMTDTTIVKENQVKVYASFVLRAVTWLVLPVMLLLACWGVPDDIKRRSLHTVVTKPVRRNEVVIGRIAGYSLIGTLLIALMGTVGYFWIDRQVQSPQAREHLIARVPVYGGLFFTDVAGLPQQRGINTGDMFDFRSYIHGGAGAKASAIYRFEDVGPHYERETTVNGKTERRIIIETQFQAFRTNKGDMTRGLHCLLTIANRMRTDFAWYLAAPAMMGDALPEILEGRFSAAGDKIENIAEQLRVNKLKSKAVVSALTNIPGGSDPNRLVTRVEFAELAHALKQGIGEIGTIQAFWRDKQGVPAEELKWITDLQSRYRRTHLAADAAANATPLVKDSHRIELADGLVSIAAGLREFETQLQERMVDFSVDLPIYSVVEFRSNEIPIPTKFTNYDAKQKRAEYHLYKDLCRNDVLRIEAKCLDPGQLLGMARPDMFIRMPDRPFGVSYTKAMVGIWLSMLMVVVLAVTASCLVKAPVATFVTAVVVLMGTQARDFMTFLVDEQRKGGGPIEDLYRVTTNKGPQSPIPDATWVDVVRFVDEGIIGLMRQFHQIIPNFRYVDQMPQYVTSGYDIPWNPSMLPAIMLTLGLLLPCLLIGHLSLKMREIEAK